MFGNDLVAVTRETAAMVSALFNRIVERGVEREAAQRFILQAVMAMFAEDIGLLPRQSFTARRRGRPRRRRQRVRPDLRAVP